MGINSSSLSPSSAKKPLLSHAHHGQENKEIQNENGIESQHNNNNPQAPLGTTFLKTCFNGLNALSGVGILSIPYALSEGGWLSLTLLLVMAIVCFYTGILLKKCMDANPLIKSYPDIGELAFGYNGRAMVAIFMCLELYLVAVEFLILEGDNLEKLFPNTVFKVAGLQIGGKQSFVLLATFIIMPTTWLKNLSLLAYISAGGVLAFLVVLVSVFWAGAVDGVGFHQKGRLLNWGGMPIAISLYSFCYCGHAVFPTIYTSMKDKRQFSKVLLLCFILCFFNYGSMAIMGYLMYGEGVKSQVTLNLPLGKLSSKIAICTTLINPFTKYAIMITPIATALEDWFPFQNKGWPISILIRTLLVISTMVVALSLPFFEYLMSFIGAFLGVAVSIVLPCLCYLKISKPYPVSGIELVIIVGILVLGSLVAVLGTYTSLKQIVNHM